MVGTFQEILDSSSGNSARIKSITDLTVLAFVKCPSRSDSSEAKYSSTELNFGNFISFRLLLHGMDMPDHFDCRARITNQIFRAMNSATRLRIAVPYPDR